jgi:hypothetical protein
MTLLDGPQAAQSVPGPSEQSTGGLLTHYVTRMAQRPAPGGTQGSASLRELRDASASGVSASDPFEVCSGTGRSLSHWAIHPVGSDELRAVEKTVLELLRSTCRDELSLHEADHEELLDWDAASNPRPRPGGTISVTLRYGGRGKPLSDPDPWT